MKIIKQNNFSQIYNIWIFISLINFTFFHLEKTLYGFFLASFQLLASLLLRFETIIKQLIKMLFEIVKFPYNRLSLDIQKVQFNAEKSKIEMNRKIVLYQFQPPHTFGMDVRDILLLRKSIKNFAMALKVTPDSNKTHAYAHTTHTSTYLYEDSQTQVGVFIRNIYCIMLDLCKNTEKKKKL